MNDLEIQVTGGLFLAAAVMLWVGWTLLPAKIGAYFLPQDFAAVGTQRRLWIWLYRLHLFGYVVAMMAFIALATLVAGSAGRIVVWPAVGVLGAGRPPVGAGGGCRTGGSYRKTVTSYGFHARSSPVLTCGPTGGIVFRIEPIAATTSRTAAS